MALEWLGGYFIVFLQVLVGVQLLRVGGVPKGLARILSALFLLNASIAALMLLPGSEAVALRSDPGWTTAVIRALDAPTGPLLFAFLALRTGKTWGRRAAVALIVLGGIHGVLELAFRSTLPLYDHYVRSPPYYAGLAVATYVLAGGAAWERWISLAFLTRAFYWGAAGVFDIATVGFGAETAIVLNRLGLFGMTIAAVAATVRLLRASEGPSHAVVVLGLVIGPAAALIETVVRYTLDPSAPFWYGSIALLNLVTLGLTRPVLTMLGVAPRALGGVALRAAAASLAGAAAAVAMSPLPLADGGRWTLYGFGLLVGALALIGLEGASASSARPEAPAGSMPGSTLDAAPARDAPTNPAASTGVDSARPHWQQIVLALRGSHLPPGETRPGEARLTQKSLVQRTGIPAARVSRLAYELNEDATSRLDAHFPGWRDEYRGIDPPQLLEHFRGSVEGTPGVWVYYRLTKLGEGLAARLAMPEPPPSAAPDRLPDRSAPRAETAGSR